MVNKHDTYTHFDHQQNDLNEWIAKSNAILNCNQMNYTVVQSENAKCLLDWLTNKIHIINKVKWFDDTSLR